MAHLTRWRVFFSSLLISSLRSGIDSFSTTSLRYPHAANWAAKHQTRRSASTSVPAGSDSAEPRFACVENLEALTVVRLKAELKARGLKQHGKKADIIRRLAETPGVLIRPQSTEVSVETLVDDNTKNAQDPPSPPTVPTEAPPADTVVAKEFQGRIPSGSSFSSEIEEAVGSGTIINAEFVTGLSEGSETARLGGEGSRSVQGLDQKAQDDVRDNQPAMPAGGPGPRPMLQLPSESEDMKKRSVIIDSLERREMTFEQKNDPPELGLPPRSDLYAVYTKKAVRPWDGPHAQRAETHVVVMLSDVFGWKEIFTRNTADNVAEITDAIVLVPDLFRGRPWGKYQPEEEYEAWRKSHNQRDVHADIRACVAHARAEYKPTSLALMGFCYGGGRALEEAAAGVLKPDNVVVFYPTRYDVDMVASSVACPVAAFFAEHDALPGATVEDARSLLDGLLINEKVPDVQVKLCPGVEHGFVHRTMKKDKDKAEDAMLLATSWLQLYLHKHFRPRGEVKKEEFGFWDLPAKDGVLIK